MAIHVAIEHVTHYKFDRAVTLYPHIIRLRPAPHARTPIHHYSLNISAENYRLYWQQDPFGNFVGRIVFPEKVTELKLDVQLIAEMTVINPFDFYVESYAEEFPFAYDQLLRQELTPYFEKTESGPLLMEWLKKVDLRKRRIQDFLVDINFQLQQHIGYSLRLDPGIQTCEKTLDSRIGSCRDTGWLLVQILRHLGLAARFVSGYLIQLKPDQKSLDGPSGTDHDFTDLHAWCEVYVPGAGWLGLDPTSGLFAGEGHIPLACTPDPVSAAPITGFTDECETKFDFANIVRRVREDPRVTKPFSDEQWEAIGKLGREVDQELEAMDVHMTMGGEPTFVSIDDMEGAEWNTEALGVQKRERAGVLLKRLREAFAVGGMLHYGQGKWYPGEPMPRWALGCYWREDGIPLWRDESLIADEHKNYNVDSDMAQKFGLQLARQLNVNPDHLIPGYEDWLYYLWREASQPRDVDSIAIPWAPQFREDMSLVLARGLDKAVGFVLPLRWNWWNSRWDSGRWDFYAGTLYLTPGGSPMGYRLPLDQLPWSAWTDEATYFAPPTSAPPTLSGMGDTQEIPKLPAEAIAADASPEQIQQRFPRSVEVPHTALCMEIRNGRLYVFMPLINSLDNYAQLLSAIEDTAADMLLPVIIEGYPPPDDYRLKSLKVTPDPGVIEVNIHPAFSWEELESNTIILYEEARLSRLATEKFMLDGRHTGTGGGNHVTLGAASSIDSPFLRRPDLLGSLLTYWQHHPSLSYMFSGVFIGPTSQAPRVDERGMHWLDEMEISLKELNGNYPPWVIDRCLRNYLADMTGNTHRAEFSIDKLYTSDTPAGRLGLLEFRAFEMPPHARMSLAQMLLLRALVARFWKEPYQKPLVRWGTSLHDRFMLPHHVWSDFSHVIKELNEAGYPFQLDWYKAFLEFRFPFCGIAEFDDLTLELHTALEPWLVLGEETTAHRQARVVDSAVERLQVTCHKFDPARYLITCNGRRVPLQATEDPNKHIAGIRFKAWNAAFGLHPTAEVHAPLVFDVIDRQIGRSVGGCVYHVAHPGGRAYDTFPVNAYEAESRRISRFWAWGHTPGETPMPEWVAELYKGRAPLKESFEREPIIETDNPYYPNTLDLRRPL